MLPRTSDHAPVPGGRGPLVLVVYGTILGAILGTLFGAHPGAILGVVVGVMLGAVLGDIIGALLGVYSVRVRVPVWVSCVVALWVPL